MRTASVVLASLMLVACAGDKQPAAEPAAPAPVPGFFGWWEIPDIDAAQDARGGAMRLAADEIGNISKEGRVAVLACRTEITGATATITGCGPAVTLTLDGDRLAISYGFTATRATAARATELDQILAAKRPAADACDHALACMRDAGPLLQTTFDPKFELGDPPSPSRCADTTSSIVMLLGERKQTVPASCQ